MYGPSDQHEALTEQVEQSVGGGGPSQAPAAPERVQHQLQRLKAVGLDVLELGQLVNHQGVEPELLPSRQVHLDPGLALRRLRLGHTQEPLEALWVDDVDVGICLQSFVFVSSVEHLDSQTMKISPLLSFSWPHAVAHAERGDEQHLVEHLFLLEELDGCQRDGGLPQAWI
jgi:hypothetical protein